MSRSIAFVGFADHVVEVFGIVRRGVGDAVADVLLEQADGDALQRLGRRADLRQHVDAVHVLVDHALQTADLALDAPQALDVGVLVGGVAVLGLLVEVDASDMLSCIPPGGIVNDEPRRIT